MEKHTVALVNIDSYEQSRVDEAVRQGIALLGGIERFVKPGEKILLKPNLVVRATAQRAATTHPAVFAAVAKLIQSAGISDICYGDSPGNPTVSGERAAEACGIKAEADALNIPIADFNTGVAVKRGNRSFSIAKAAMEADGIINICKMKTHALERITGGVKNIYGCINGVNKEAGHAAHPTPESFAAMLADLYATLPVRLTIMDGIMAMEGNGPTSGDPTHMNVLLFSDDPVALDSVFANLVYLDPSEVPTNVKAAKIGIGVMDEKLIDIETPDGPITMAQAREKHGRRDFNVYRGRLKKTSFFKLLHLPVNPGKPIVDNDKCIACGICEEVCPVNGKAVHSGKGKKAEYDYKKCISCFCCQEMCPVQAINVYRGRISKLMKK